MKAIQRIVRNGNSATVTIPRTMMFQQNWRLGDLVLVQSFEDGHVEICPWMNPEAPIRSPGIIAPDMPEVKR